MSEDLEKLRLETENLQLKCALEFYAEGRHLWHADKRDATTHKEYDSVSGVVENGAYAFEKLREIEDELPEKIGKLEAENKRLQKELDEALETQRTNAWKIQMQAERGAKYAKKKKTPVCGKRRKRLPTFVLGENITMSGMLAIKLFIKLPQKL